MTYPYIYERSVTRPDVAELHEFVKTGVDYSYLQTMLIVLCILTFWFLAMFIIFWAIERKQANRMFQPFKFLMLGKMSARDVDPRAAFTLTLVGYVVVIFSLNGLTNLAIFEVFKFAFTFGGKLLW